MQRPSTSELTSAIFRTILRPPQTMKSVSVSIIVFQFWKLKLFPDATFAPRPENRVMCLRTSESKIIIKISLQTVRCDLWLRHALTVAGDFLRHLFELVEFFPNELCCEEHKIFFVPFISKKNFENFSHSHGICKTKIARRSRKQLFSWWQCDGHFYFWLGHRVDATESG